MNKSELNLALFFFLLLCSVNGLISQNHNRCTFHTCSRGILNYHIPSKLCHRQGTTLSLSTEDLGVQIYDAQLWFSHLAESQLATISPLSLGFLFIAGLLTSLSPCVIGLLPLTLAYLGGGSDEKGNNLYKQDNQCCMCLLFANRGRWAANSIHPLRSWPGGDALGVRVIRRLPRTGLRDSCLGDCTWPDPSAVLRYLHSFSSLTCIHIHHITITLLLLLLLLYDSWTGGGDGSEPAGDHPARVPLPRPRGLRPAAGASEGISARYMHTYTSYTVLCHAVLSVCLSVGH